MSIFALPSGPSEMSAAWLTAALREGGIIRQSRVVSADYSLIGQEWGVTGVIARVQVEYDAPEEGAPTSLIAKFPTAARETESSYTAGGKRDTPAARRQAERAAREVHFYRQVARGGSAPTPTLYYAAADASTNRIVLLMEDLARARPGDAVEGCTPAEAAQVVTQMAAFHATWWENPLLENFAWLPRWGSNSAALHEKYGTLAGAFLRMYGAKVPERLVPVIYALRPSLGAIVVRLGKSPVTLVHGDLHLDNILFNAPGARPPLTIIDWQTVSKGRGVIDLSVFITGALTVEDRRANEEQLLRHYRALLVERGVIDYTLARLYEDYTLTLLWQLEATIRWLGSVDIQDLVGRERTIMESVLTEGKLFTALLDHNAPELVSKF